MFDKNLFTLPNIKRIFILLVFNSCLQAIFIGIQGLSLAYIISKLWRHPNFKGLYWYIVIFIISFLSRYILDALRDRTLSIYTNKISFQVRDKLLSKIFKLGPVLSREHGTGNLITMTLDGVDQISEYIKLSLSKSIDMIMIPIIILAIVFLLNFIVGLILLLAFPLIILFMIILGKSAQIQAKKKYNMFQQLSNYFIDSIRGLRNLKQLGISKSYEKSIYKTSERFRKATMNTLVVAMTSSFALDFFSTLSIAIIAVYLGFKLIYGQINLFPAMAALILSPEYFLPIQNFAKKYHETLNGKNALDSINKIFNIKIKKPQSIDIPVWDSNSSLQITNMDVKYNNGNTGLFDINLYVKGYQKIGVVGLSGSGKSTLINTLSGFLTPLRGQIQINDQKLDSFAQSSWQKQIIEIPQNPYIFQLSLIDNIKFYTPEATKEQVENAIDIVGLRKLVNKLPNGINTIIGNGGRSLSGGQSQQIALARALLDKQRKIILFDEPTAHLDIETEFDLKEKMLPIMNNKLVFFATHRLHWLKQMDYIIVLKNGKIKEQGTLNHLISDNDGELSHLLKEVRKI